MESNEPDSEGIVVFLKTAEKQSKLNPPWYKYLVSYLIILAGFITWAAVEPEPKAVGLTATNILFYTFQLWLFIRLPRAALDMRDFGLFAVYLVVTLLYILAAFVEGLVVQSTPTPPETLIVMLFGTIATVVDFWLIPPKTANH
ncbi:hypothetical protein KBC79_00495 [Candidatus Woesebacteria bacterium]|nr:hypothetical protein [Candidatus Woesebacteria bacterium]